MIAFLHLKQIFCSHAFVWYNIQIYYNSKELSLSLVQSRLAGQLSLSLFKQRLFKATLVLTVKEEPGTEGKVKTGLDEERTDS